MSAEKNQAFQQLRRAVALRQLQQRGYERRESAEAPPILVVDRGEALTLSWAQQRLWFLGQLDEAASAAYHMPVALRLSGELNREALRASLDRIVARHENLRTTFVSVDGAPRQVIAAEDSGFTLFELDLRDLDQAAQAAAVDEMSASESRAPFDMATGPLIRGRLLHLAEREHVLLLTKHHIISDGWSIGVLVKEVSALYTAFSRGEADPLLALPVQYADYAAWQRQWLQGEVLQAQLDFWRNHLTGAPELLELPADRPRPAVQSYRGDRIAVRVSSELTTALRSLSQRHGMTLFMALLASWSALLSRLSGQGQVVIGTPVANRMHWQIEPLIGFFVNTLALRVDLSSDPSVSELLAQIKDTTLGAYAHQDLPFEQVVEALRPTRSLSHSAVFQTMLSLSNAPDGGQQNLPGLTLSALEIERRTSHFDLSLSLKETSDGLAGGLEYSLDLFDRETVERYLRYWLYLLSAMIADDTQAVSRLPLLSQPEREHVLVEFNATRADYPQDRLIHEFFETQAARQPEATALVCEDQQLSYAELNRRANQVAHYLKSLGVRPDDRIVICMKRNVEMVVAVLGVLKSGGAYVPLDPDLPGKRLTCILESDMPVALLTLAETRKNLPALRLLRPLRVVSVDDEPAIARQPDGNPIAITTGLNTQHLVYVIYTSGSTGMPKGVMVPHRAVVNYLTHADTSYLRDGICGAVVATPLGFDATVTTLLAPWLTGRPVVVLADDSDQCLSQMLNYCKRSEPWLFKLTPAHLDVLCTLMNDSPVLTPHRLVVGGEQLTRRTLDRFRNRVLPNAIVVNEYGPTETVVGCTTFVDDGCQERSPGEAVPIGRPIANTQIYILDAQGQPVPVGVAGEIHIGGAGVVRGYLNLPELTAERFLHDPFSSDADARMYKTGDLGRWLADGNVEYLGRNDFQVKVRGFRIELGEIQAKLVAIAAIRDAVVIAREDVPGDKRLVAYVTLASGTEVPVAGLRDALSRELPEYMIPSSFVTLKALPLTPNGKLDRKALPMPHQASVASREYAAPVGEVEQTIAEIWCELLGLERVGRDDHFFELGGHSLMVIALIERLRLRGLSADVRTIFVTPTLHALAAELAGGNASLERASVAANPITPQTTAITPELLPLVSLTQAGIDAIVSSVPGGVSNIQDIYPLAPLQEGILFHHLLGGDGDGDSYLHRFVVAFDGQERMRRFLDCLQQVIDRHDILRSAVYWEDMPRPVQVVQRLAPLPVIELQAAPEESALTCLLAATDPRQLRLDLRRAPMLAVYIVHDPQAGEWLMALLDHHMVGDHITQDLILSEIQMLLHGHGDRLPVPVPYRNFIASNGAIPDAVHEAFFREQLGDIDEPTAPFGVLSAPDTGNRQLEAKVQFDDALSLRIRDVARRHGVTPATLFHVGWGQVLAECSDRDDVVFGTVVSGRLQGSEAADRGVGMFINTLPVRLKLGGLRVAEAVHRAHVGLSDLLAHEQAPLALAQRCSAMPAQMPLFTALLNYRYNDGSGSTKELAASVQAWEGMRVVARGKTHGSYPMTMSVEDWGQTLGLSLLHVQGIDGERFVGYFENAMKALAAALESEPSIPVRSLAVMTPAERRRLLVDLGSAPPIAADAQDHLIHELFEAQVQRQPNADALIFEDRVLGYDEVNRKANQLAHYLRSIGVKPDVRVAICMERSIEMAVAVLAVLKAGGAYVPLDPALPPKRLTDILKNDMPVALLTVLAVEDKLPAMSLLRVVVVDDEPAIARQPEHNPGAATTGLNPQHLAYVIYTSGSTGTPKGVMVPHRGVVSYLAHADASYLQDGICGGVVATPLSFDATVTTLMAPWLAGKPVVLLAEDSDRCLSQLLSYCGRPEPWLFKLTPAHLGVLSTLMQAAPVATPHRLVVGGEQLTTRTLKRFRERVLPNAIVVNEYGPTETVVGCTTFVSDGSQDQSLHEAVPIGRPIASTRIYVLGKHGEPVPAGVAGEIHIGGAGVARGYLNRPELTAERFLSDPFSDDVHARMYKTGDLGRWLEDGNLEYLGRNDFQVKVRGFRIELGEIEAKLAVCTGVREAVVIAREDAPGDKRLVAYVVPEVGEALSAASLRESLLRELPEYMVPGAFVILERLPLTPNGKLDRKALPAPDQTSVASRAYEAPVGEVEQALAAIWQELLSLERVGRHDDFFELGGHSLLAVRLVTRLRVVLGVDVALRDVFAQPTLSALARTASSASDASETAIVPVDRNQVLPLSWAQQRLWFLDQLDHEAGAAYHVSAALRLSGDLNRDALRASLDRIVARHESLRTTFVSVDGAPRQIIAAEDCGFTLIQHELRHLDEAAQAAAVTELSASEARAPFDLSRGPLIRGRLLHLSEREHVLLVTQHHIISDGWSIGVLVKEVSALYTAFSQGEADPLPPLQIQYADYAAWQRQWLQGDVLQGQLDFWRNHLSGAPALLELPTDRPRPAVLSYRGESVSVRLSRELSADLRALSRRHGVTLYMTLLAAWSTLLSRLSGQDDIVIGSPVANRQRSEIEPLIGFFVNTLALRVDLSNDPSVADLLAQIKATTVGAYAHQDLPFEQVVEVLQPVRILSYSPVFQVMLALNNTPESSVLDLPGLALSGIESEQRAAARFDLSLSLTDTAGGLVGGVIYAVELFEHGTIERMMRHWVTLLTAMVADDTQAMSRLPLLSSSEHEQVLSVFNATTAAYPHDRLFHEQFEAQAAQRPDAPALMFEDQQLSYAELNGRANQVAHGLIALGVKPDDRVALCTERSLEAVIGLLGILKAGGAYVPLDPMYPADRLAYMLEDSAPAAVLTQSALRSRLPVLASIGKPVLALDETADASPSGDMSNPQVPGLASRHLAYVIYTSGSTGQPKGVMVEHASVMNLWMELERSIFGMLSEHDRVGLNAALSFDSSVKSLLQLLSGRCVVVIPQAARADAAALLDFLASHRVEAFDCTPAQLELLLDKGLLDSKAYQPKAVLIGGEAIAVGAWQRMSRSTRTQFFNVYGPTECTVDSTLVGINGTGDRPQIGGPIANVRIYILDRQGQPVPIGAPGELFIAGVGVARGYLNRPELTAERFIKDPFADDADARMYKTGDLGRWMPDGSIEFVGRNDFQVKVRGFRIELGEIEAKLAACAGVREAVVIAREDVPGDKRLVAYVVPRIGEEATAVALRESLLQELPEYMIPSAFVSLTAMPLTPNGKLDRRALPAPDQGSVASRAYEAPVGEVEEAIAQVWQELLDLERVGRNDHFFELGGHSLLAVRVMVRLKDVLQVDVDLRDVFVSPQLSVLAEVILERQFEQFDQSELLEVLSSMKESSTAD